MRRNALLLLLLTPTIALAQMSSEEAFRAGKTDGNTLQRAAPPVIRGQDPSVIPGYATTPPAEAMLFDSGRGVLGVPAAAKLADCTPPAAGTPPRTTPPTTTPGIQECNAITFIQGNAHARPAFAIDPKTDSMIQGSLATLNTPRNPSPVGGAYSGCTTRTVTRPGATSTETCQRATQLTPFTCERTLAVTVHEKGSCIPGEWYARGLIGAAYEGHRFTGIEVAARCDYADELSLIVRGATWNEAYGETVLAVDARTGAVSGAILPLVMDGIGGQDFHFGHWHTHARYEGGGCIGNACDFAFSAGIFDTIVRCPDGTVGPPTGDPPTCSGPDREPVAANVTTEYVPRYPGRFRFDRAHLTYSFEDRWDDGCAPYVARLP